MVFADGMVAMAGDSSTTRPRASCAPLGMTVGWGEREAQIQNSCGVSTISTEQLIPNGMKKRYNHYDICFNLIINDIVFLILNFKKSCL
jgi:hypothetical protein